ncbi:hypothetical protein KY386_03800 [Candidatus Parcubacteria bacterium]|nr:hypothetical protein [Candidatus Parcubacteria bacterium]
MKRIKQEHGASTVLVSVVVAAVTALVVVLIAFAATDGRGEEGGNDTDTSRQAVEALRQEVKELREDVKQEADDLRKEFNRQDTTTQETPSQ